MVPLKITTDSSLLQSLIKVSDLIKFAKENNLTSLAICDNTLFASMEFYLKCKDNNINPIIGLEVTIEGKEVYLYAKNYAGYQKLLKLNTTTFEREINVKELDDNIKVIIPYKSSSLYTSFSNKNNIYIGYHTEEEKKNALILSPKVVYVNSAHALKKEDIPYLKYLQDLGGKFTYDNESYLNIHHCSYDENTTIKFSEDINIDIPFNNRYIPEYKKGIDAFKYLKNLVYLGLSKRFNKNVSEIYLKRADKELEVINKMGFVNYFLIVYDYVLFAKKSGIKVGPGRGSAAGALVSYAIGITDIDPIKYDLLFERFLNPYRAKMPDIDIDFEDARRGEVINYVKEKYGEDKVALGLTFTNYKSKLILRDLAKVLKIDNHLLEKFIKVINSSYTLKKNLENDSVKKYLSLYKDLNELYNIAMHLEGLKKSISTHAAGVVISSVPLDDIIPIYKENAILKTGITMDYLESLGLLKMDFLGLRNLSLISSISNTIKDFNINDIPLDDQKTYELLQSGDTSDIFQFESNYASLALHKLEVKNFDELAIAVALVRPGPNKQMESYIKNKNEGYTIHPDLKDILSPTYGIIIFQEQVMQILTKIAGYTGYEADNIRTAMSKKKEEIITKERQNFITKAISRGYEKSFVEDLYAKIVKFGEFSFNKSHSVAYAIIVYEIAYLKANYPNNYNAVMLSEASSSEKRKKYINALIAKDIKILKPLVSVPSKEFRFKNNHLLLPLSIIKDLNELIVDELIKEMAKGSYIDIYDFIMRTKDFITPSVFTTLVLSGALDCFNITRSSLIESSDLLFNYADVGDPSIKPVLMEKEEYSDDYLRECELKYYGMYIANHPCSKYQNVIKAHAVKDYLFKNINMVLLVEKIHKIKTKKGENMSFIMASDETGKVELTLFPSIQKNCQDLKEGDIILINGKSSKRFADYKIIVNKLTRNKVIK